MNRGATLIEVLVATLVLALAVLPLMAMIQTGSRESVESEYAMFAEVLAARAVERLMASGYHELSARVPFEETLRGIPEDAPEDARQEKAFQMKFAGELGFVTSVRVSKLRDGLLAVEAVVRRRRPTGPREHRFALLRLVAQPDLSIEARYRTEDAGK